MSRRRRLVGESIPNGDRRVSVHILIFLEYPKMLQGYLIRVKVPHRSSILKSI